MIGLGLFISTKAATRDAAMQMTMGTVLPAVFLSGYVFPYTSMPTVFRGVANLVPATWLIDAARCVILRGGGWPELWHHSLVLWLMAVATLTASALRFRKRLT
jgi:ABC-2 type transport system permease protein